MWNQLNTPETQTSTLEVEEKKPTRPVFKKRNTLAQQAAALSSKKKNVSSLVESKKAWDKFVEKEQIADDLKYRNKDG